MAIEIKCSSCGKVLETPGALLFGVPGDIPRSIYNNYSIDVSDLCKKYHLCVNCADKVIDFIDNGCES